MAPNRGIAVVISRPASSNRPQNTTNIANPAALQQAGERLFSDHRLLRSASVHRAAVSAASFGTVYDHTSLGTPMDVNFKAQMAPALEIKLRQGHLFVELIGTTTTKPGQLPRPLARFHYVKDGDYLHSIPTYSFSSNCPLTHIL